MKQYNFGAPFERISEFLFPLTEDFNRYILVAIDYFRLLVHNITCRFGIPLELHSEQERNFESGVFQEVCKILSIRKTITTPLNPQSDGVVRRFSKTMEEHLRKVGSE